MGSNETTRARITEGFNAALPAKIASAIGLDVMECMDIHPVFSSMVQCGLHYLAVKQKNGSGIQLPVMP